MSLTLDWYEFNLQATHLRVVSGDLLVEVALLRQNFCGIVVFGFLAVCSKVQPEYMLFLVLFQGHIGSQGRLADPEHPMDDNGNVAGLHQ